MAWPNRADILPFLSWLPKQTRASVGRDAVVGLSGAILALPQSIAYALIAGLPPEYGLYAAIVPVIIACLWGSSWHLICGPTAAISIVLFASVSPMAVPGSQDYIGLILLLTFLAGIFQWLMGMLKFGALANFVSHSVVLGFTLGAAVVIALGQLPNALGLDIPSKATALDSLLTLLAHVREFDRASLGLALATLLVGVVFKRWLARWPGLLIALISASLVVWCWPQVFGHVQLVQSFVPWLPGLVDLLQHMDELKSGGDVGWEPAVDARSLPAMTWQLLIQDEGDNLPWPLFWLAPLALLGGVTGMAVRDSSPHKFITLIVIYTLLPILAIYAVSFISPLFIERYVMFAALGLPLLVAIAVDQLFKRKRALAIALLSLFVGTELVGLRSNFSSDADHFDRLVEHVNQQFKPGDRIVVSDLFWYFSFVYYNKTGFQPMLYTPPLEDGTSGRPNDYGFGTLVNAHGKSIYVDRLSDLPPGPGRIWLISSKVQPDDFSAIPIDWRKAQDLAVDDTQARLYLTCVAAQCGPEPEWSQLDAKANP